MLARAQMGGGGPLASHKRAVKAQDQQLQHIQQRRTATTAGGQNAARRPTATAAAAAGSGGDDPKSTATTTTENPSSTFNRAAAAAATDAARIAEEEARIEAREAAGKKSRKAAAPLPPPGSSGKPRRQIPIRGVTPVKEPESGSGARARWPAGQLLPDGWEKMDALERATELWLGERGFLALSGQAAYWGAGLLIGGWVVFRVVLPALGLYKLAGDALPQGSGF